MPTVLRIIVYPVFGLVCLILFSVILFPFDSLKGRVAREIEQGLGGGYAITIGGLAPAPIAGMVLKDVQLRPRGAPDAPPVKLDKAKLKFALFSLLTGSIEVDFDLRPPTGRAQGSFSRKRGGMALSLKMSQFDLALAAFLAQKAGIPLSGKVGGEASIEIHSDDPLRNSGKISLQIPELVLGETSLGFLKLPALRLAQADQPGSGLEVQINRGNIEVQTLRLTGADVGLEASGKVYGARRADNFRFNLKGVLRISDEIIAKVPILSTIEKQKQPDGTYPFTVTGRIMKPSIRIGDFKLPI